ncbi:MAG: hypothetical protein DRJ42_29560 [Deltaproteobacteria bacterium]|nr:MAG: hypothetical protein DRJ42_29560 [Deltaproteobacteria bacterium]
MEMQSKLESPENPRPVVEAEECCMVLGRAVSDVRLSQIGPDVWSLFTMHGAGNSRFQVRLPNRLLVFRVRDAAGKASLVIVNAVWPDEKKDEPFRALRALSEELGAPIRFIINPGPEHHMSLDKYARAFPDARVCVAAGRIERENPALCALDNVETMAVGDALPELSNQGLHVHVWDGFMEGTLINRSQMRFGARRGTAEPTVFWHEASGSFLNGGHGWFYWAEGDKQPWPIRKMMRLQEGHVTWSPAHYRVHDEGRCIDSARRILDWGFDSLIDLHAGADKRIDAGAHEVAKGLLRPLIDANWDELPFGREALEIPEGTVTGGGWKSYR